MAGELLEFEDARTHEAFHRDPADIVGADEVNVGDKRLLRLVFDGGDKRLVADPDRAGVARINAARAALFAADPIAEGAD